MEEDNTVEQPQKASFFAPDEAEREAAMAIAEEAKKENEEE